MIICILLSLMNANMIGQEIINLGDSLKITVPKEFKSVPKTNFSYEAATEDGQLLLVQKIDTESFDVSKVFDKVDGLAFNLESFEKNDEKSDGFFDFGKDYVLKEYVNKENNVKLYTYTAYMKNFPYVILYIPAEEDTDMKSALNIIQSTIDDSGDTWWQRVVLLFKRAWWTYFTIGLVMAVILSATNNKYLYWLFVAIGCWMFSPAWGDWLVYLPVVAAFMILMFICKSISLSDWGGGNGDGVDIDFDF